MRLGGWTRLWVVVGALYLLLVCAVSVFWFPAEANIPQSAVYARMGPDDSKKLIVGYEFTPQGMRKTSASGDPREIFTDDELRELSNDPKLTTNDWFKLTSSELRRMNAIIDGLPDENRLAKSRRTVTVDVANGQLNFSRDVSSPEKSRVTSAYGAALRRELLASRVKFSAYALLGWVVPWLSVYTLGWSVGWVWRGFKQGHRNGKAV